MKAIEERGESRRAGAQGGSLNLVANVGQLADRLKNARLLEGKEAVFDLSTILEHAQVAAERAERQIRAQQERIKRLEEMIVTDELTGLLNRRGFRNQLHRTLAAARRYGTEGLLGYVDLDEFKGINDKFGHEAGDEVLRITADFFRESLRETDVVGRLGGDEFALLLVHTSEDHGRQRMSQVEQIVNGATVRVGNHEIALRASFGVTPYRSSDAADAILKRADDAMYEIKRQRSHIVRDLRQTA